MERPTLADFGLEAGDPRRYERWESLLSWSPVARVAVCALAGTLTAELAGDRSIGVITGGVLSVVAMSRKGDEAEEAILRALLPKLHRVRSYRTAVREFAKVWAEARRAEQQRKEEYWLTLSGHEFEVELASVFRRLGYEVHRTQDSHDGGVDLFLRLEGRTTIVQCKQSKNPIGPGAARDLYGALIHFNADSGILATTGPVTSGVEAFFLNKPLRVISLGEIVALHEKSLLNSAQHNELAEPNA